MPETRTIFLAVDGRYVTLGRATSISGDELQQLREQAATTATRGWVAVVTGKIHGKRPVQVVRSFTIGGEDGEWAAAVAAFNASRS